MNCEPLAGPTERTVDPGQRCTAPDLIYRHGLRRQPHSIRLTGLAHCAKEVSNPALSGVPLMLSGIGLSSMSRILDNLVLGEGFEPPVFTLREQIYSLPRNHRLRRPSINLFYIFWPDDYHLWIDQLLSCKTNTALLNHTSRFALTLSEADQDAQVDKRYFSWNRKCRQHDDTLKLVDPWRIELHSSGCKPEVIPIILRAH